MNLRHSKITVDLEAIRHNYQYLKQQSVHNCCIAVIKANAYGHGAIQVAKALSSAEVEADAFAVATVPEAVELRQAGIKQKIIVLGGFINRSEYQIAKQQQLDCVVHSFYQVEYLTTEPDTTLNLWVKINSGMGRLGFDIVDVEKVISTLSAYKKMTLMTHLANADDVSDEKTQQQLAIIDSLGLAQFDWSVANSAGTLGWLKSHKQWNRLGISLYGINPLITATEKTKELKPAMQFESQIVAKYTRKKGESIGYGATYICQDDMIIGVVGAGYGDGYPRYSHAKGNVLINGELVAIVGRISMDMITVDLTHIQSGEIGDTVILWGKSPTVEQVAKNSETIAYELCCNAGAHIQAEYINP